MTLAALLSGARPTVAAEALLAAALKNPRNQKFFMLSESDLPLYSPHVMYLQVRCRWFAVWELLIMFQVASGVQGFRQISQRAELPTTPAACWLLQLMSEHRSRINACNTTRGWDLDFYRWVDRMETSFLKKHLWRKSSQVSAHGWCKKADRQSVAHDRSHMPHQCRQLHDCLAPPFGPPWSLD